MRGVIAARTAVMTAIAALDAGMRRYQSGEVDYTGSISKCGDRRVRTPLYEAASVTLTRCKGQLKLKDRTFAIAKRSTMRKARIALAPRRRNAHDAAGRNGVRAPTAHQTGDRIERPEGATPKGGSSLRRRFYRMRLLLHAANDRPTAISTTPPYAQLTPSSAGEHVVNTGIPWRRNPARASPLTHLRTKSGESGLSTFER
jgi:hypothetical protein